MRQPLHTRLPSSAKALLIRASQLVPARWRLTPATRRALAFVQKSERWTIDRWRAHQDAQVRRVVQHAYEQVPYYRETWRAASIQPTDVDGVAALRQLPAIDNRIVRAHFDDLIARDVPAWRHVVHTTGGTSGVPTRLLFDKRIAPAIEISHMTSLWQRVGYRLGDRRILLRGALLEDTLYRYDRAVDGYWFSSFQLSDDVLEQLVDLMRSFRPRFLHTYPSAATLLANFVRRRGIELPPLAAVLASSENMYPGQRELIEETFGTRLFSWYGHSEGLVLAGECEHSNDYHAFPGYGSFDLVGADGSSVTEPGGAGEIVGTGFHNPVMPLIRYATGDWATFVDSACKACGRSYPVLRDVRGHYWQELIVGAEGQLISATAVNVHDDTFDRVNRYQFHQHVRGAITLRLVPEADFGPADEARIRERMQRRLGGLELVIERVASIAATGPGKWKYLVQDLREGRLGGGSPGAS